MEFVESCILYFTNVRSKISIRREERSTPMTREEAAKYIERLSYDEKRQLNDLLRALAQKHQLSASLRVSKKPDAK